METTKRGRWHAAPKRTARQIENEPAYFAYIDALHERYDRPGAASLGDVMSKITPDELARFNELAQAAGYPNW